MAKYSDTPVMRVSVEVDSTTAELWPLISDIELPTRFSAELQRVGWLDDEDGGVGARFTGTNRHEFRDEWQTTSTVVECELERTFSWAVEDVANPSATWAFELEPTGTGTTLTMWARMGPGPSGLTPVIEAMPEKEERIVDNRLQEWKQNMTATVEGIKALAESRG